MGRTDFFKKANKQLDVTIPHPDVKAILLLLRAYHPDLCYEIPALLGRPWSTHLMVLPPHLCDRISFVVGLLHGLVRKGHTEPQMYYPEVKQRCWGLLST